MGEEEVSGSADAQTDEPPAKAARIDESTEDVAAQEPMAEESTAAERQETSSSQWAPWAEAETQQEEEPEREAAGLIEDSAHTSSASLPDPQSSGTPQPAASSGQ